MFIRGPPPPQTTHTTTVWTHETTVWVNTPQRTTGKQPSEPHFYQGSPPSNNTHNHCVGTRNHCVGKYTSKNYWKTTVRAPCFSEAPLSPAPPNNTHNHCVDTRNHCVSNGKLLGKPHVHKGFRDKRSNIIRNHFKTI